MNFKINNKNNFKIMLIPDLHIESLQIENKKTQHKFYLPNNIFEDTCLIDIRSKYNKYLFKIDIKDFKTEIKYNEDNINIDFLNFRDKETNSYIKYDNNNIIKMYTDDKKAICYISDKNMNWYLIKMDSDSGNGTITCITEKIQDEKDVIENVEEEPNTELEKNNNENIQYDIEYDIESID